MNKNRVKKPLQLSGKKSLKITALKRKEEELYFACIIPSPKLVLLGVKRKVPI